MMYGWTGRILKIDLSTEVTAVEEPPLSFYETFIGGKGMAGYYLHKYVTRNWDDPDMPLLFFTGPLVNTPSPTSGRMTIMSRSPLTGTIGDTSAGGKLGVQLKRAGWDGIIVRGRSDRPRGIQIKDSSIEFVDADHLQGLLVSEASAKLPKEGSTAITGPAAENGVLFANIVIDGHYCAGRNGLGLVMAARNLKYINVQGSGKTAIADREVLMKAREEIFRLAAASPALMGELGFTHYGTGALYDLMDSRRMMPTDNFRSTHFKDASRMNAWSYKQKYGTKKSGCAGCHIQCKKVTRDNRAVPEFETMSHFSALLRNDDLETSLEANRLCNEFGMDTISTGSTIACYEEITGSQIAGNALLDVFRDIGTSRGEGALLKLGSARYAARMGRPELAMAVKSMELPAYDPRGAYGMALGYVTSTRGGCHLRAYPITNEILRKPVATDRFSFSGKARMVKISEDMNAVVDSLTACKFVFFAATLEEFSDALRGVTGMEVTAQDLLRTGERIYYHERIMNALNGFTSRDDDLPPRFFNEDGSSGDGIEIGRINRQDFLEARANYYRIRGLDRDGMPTKEKCSELGLECRIS